MSHSQTVLDLHPTYNISFYLAHLLVTLCSMQKLIWDYSTANSQRLLTYTCCRSSPLKQNLTCYNKDREISLTARTHYGTNYWHNMKAKTNILITNASHGKDSWFVCTFRVILVHYVINMHFKCLGWQCLRCWPEACPRFSHTSSLSAVIPFYFDLLLYLFISAVLEPFKYSGWLSHKYPVLLYKSKGLALAIALLKNNDQPH